MGGGVLATCGPDMKRYKIPNPKLFNKKDKKRIIDAYKILTKREVKSIFEELKQKDRKKLDDLILHSLGFDAKLYRPKLSSEFIELVNIRKKLAGMRKQVKNNIKKANIQKLKERAIKEIVKPNYRKFPEAFLPESKIEWEKYGTTGEKIYLKDEFMGQFTLYAGEDLVYQGNEFIARFILYSYETGQYTFKFPIDPIIAEQTLERFYQYIKELKQKLFEFFNIRVGSINLATKLVEDIIKEIYNDL